MIKKLRVLLIVSAFLVIFSGAASALETKTKRVDVEADGKVTSLNTLKNTVGEVLDGMDITLAKDDVVTPELTAEVPDGGSIKVYRAFMVNVKVDGAPRRIKVSKGTVKDAKEKIEQSINAKTKLLGNKETDELTADMTIELSTSYTELYEVKSEIPFSVSYVENPDVEDGIETVVTEGVNGVSVTVYEKRYEGETLVSSDEIETRIETPPVDKVIEKGTMLKFDPVPVAQDTPAKTPDRPVKYSEVFTMTATAYTSDRGDSGTHTFTGERARVGLVAVDPRRIPLGTLLYVENYGLCRAADTGGAIKGNKIDLFFNTYEECINFGRRTVTVYVLEDTDDLVAIEGLLGFGGEDMEMNVVA